MKKLILKVTTLFMLLAYSTLFAQVTEPGNDPDPKTLPLPTGLRYLYVSTTGNDDNTGEIDQPFQTINKAAQVAIAGDVVVIKAGTYIPTSSIVIANEGTSINPITFFADVRDGVIIDGSASSTPNATDRQGLFTILGTSGNYKSGIVVDGLRIINSKFAGFYARYSDNITIKDCSSYNTGASGIIAANSSNIKVLNNKVQQACMYPDSSVDTNECITMASVNTFEVAYNAVSDRLTDPSNGGEGIDAKNNCISGTIHHNTVRRLTRVGIYIDAFSGNLSNIEVYNNKIYSIISGISVASEQGGIVDGVKIHDNLIYDTDKCGIRIAGYLNNGPLKNLDVYQNTVVNCGFNAGTWENVGLLIEATNTDNTGFNFRNNIITGCPFQVRANGQTFPYVLDNNILFGSTVVSGTNTITVDPKFKNPTSKDFRLGTDSPAIDKGAGTPLSIKDYNDASRPSGAGYDLGAYEYQFATWVGTASTNFGVGSNWQTGVAPLSTDLVAISSGAPNYPVISVNTSIAGGIIKSGASITVNEGKTLTNTGVLTNDGNLILKSSAAGTANLLSDAIINNVTLQRYLSSNQRGWRLLSNPLASTTFSALATASNITLGTGFTGEYLTAPGLGSWTSTNGTVAMENNKAYKVFITGKTGEAPAYANGPTNVTLVINGAAANTPPTSAVTNANQYYLVANPYTAPLSVRSIIAASTNLSNTVSYYNPTNLSNGTTDLKLKKGGYDYPIISAGAQGDANDVVIPPMGAIFVKASSAGTINVPKTAIFTGTNNSGPYTHKTDQTKVVSTNALKIEINSGGIHYDTVAILFKEVGTAGSNIDFGKLPNTIFDFYSFAGTQKMAVSELEFIEQTIPLGISTTELKSFTFKVAENSIAAGFEAVLIDNVLNTKTVLTPGTNYSFAIDSNAARQGDARFAINLKTSSSLSLVDEAFDSKIQLWPNPAKAQFNITNDLNQKEGASTIEISTVNGQVIHNQKSNPGTTTTIQTNGWAEGVYILKATNNGTQTTKKLVIQ